MSKVAHNISNYIFIASALSRIFQKGFRFEVKCRKEELFALTQAFLSGNNVYTNSIIQYDSNCTVY